uniref:C-type lectin domain-containing protein n=1 Tax=Bubo bubo TaxID=30461 RepID=A0A8C0FVU8_BUBBB
MWPLSAPALCPWWHSVLLKVSGLGHLVLLVLVVVLSKPLGAFQPVVGEDLGSPFGLSHGSFSSSACSGCKLCPQEWQLHGDRCYWLSKEKGNWTQGKKGCENQEAQLVVLRNKKEKKSLKIITGTQTVWVGLLSSPKELRWVDNTSFNAKTWGSLEKTDEGCGTLKEELEVDICDDEHKWVCQKDPFQLFPSTADGEKCDGAV